MRLLTGKRIGLSGQELLVAVLFSFFIHVIVLLFALFLDINGFRRVFVPPAYTVMLVRPVPEPAPVIPEPPKPMPKEVHRQNKMARHKKAVMPSLKEAAQKKEGIEKVVSEPKASAPESVPQHVLVEAAPGFKFPWYLAILGDKIRRNWNPPPGAAGLRTRVVFKIYRSGLVAGADIEQGSGNFYFDQAAMRAILSSSPFPPLPEEFARESVDVSVDLEPKE